MGWAADSRSRALESNMYVVAPNIGGYHLFPEDETPIDAGGGNSMVVDYRGAITEPPPKSPTGSKDVRAEMAHLPRRPKATSEQIQQRSRTRRKTPIDFIEYSDNIIERRAARVENFGTP